MKLVVNCRFVFISGWIKAVREWASLLRSTPFWQELFISVVETIVLRKKKALYIIFCWLSVDCDSQTDDNPEVTASKTNRTPEQQKQDEEDIADIDLKDPDLQKAASKIQATFRKKIAPKKPASAVGSSKSDVAGGKTE